MSGMERKAFVDRIRNALGADANRTPTAPPIDESLVRLAGADVDCITLFAERAREVGMIVHQTKPAALAQTVCSLMEKHECRRAVIAVGDDELSGVLHEAARGQGDVIDWAAGEGMDAHFDADVGITDVEAALAETGTLIVSTDRRHPRGAYLAPPVHIAIVKAAQIVPDMLDYMASLAGEVGADIPSATVFITGPSKTADIEGVLVTGVHGPREVHVIVVE